MFRYLSYLDHTFLETRIIVFFFSFLFGHQRSTEVFSVFLFSGQIHRPASLVAVASISYLAPVLVVFTLVV